MILNLLILQQILSYSFSWHLCLHPSCSISSSCALVSPFGILIIILILVIILILILISILILIIITGRVKTTFGMAITIEENEKVASFHGCLFSIYSVLTSTDSLLTSTDSDSILTLLNLFWLSVDFYYAVQTKQSSYDMSPDALISTTCIIVNMIKSIIIFV